ncbi:MAG: WbqC family protein [Bacteroidales bacterium]|nr:WbqC family protein [Bacteroidales bacterium]MCF8404964.1 WbqC family protein [Bacteroidales bacterium]
MEAIQTIILPTAYAGQIIDYAYYQRAEKVFFESEENYIKQTFRNRTVIMTANGPFPLIIPVIKVNGNHTKIKDILICNKEKWQQLHWRTLTTAYSNSPFFLFYQDALQPFYSKKFDRLLDFNLELLQQLLNLLNISCTFSISKEYKNTYPGEWVDLRNKFTPKIEVILDFPAYEQVFQEKYNFAPNLSIFDLLFNIGPSSTDYLKQLNPPVFS